MFTSRSVLLCCGAFVLVALSLDWFFATFIIRQSELSNEYKVHRLLTSSAPGEIPVFGSSKARSAFIPDSIGAGCYNYGMEKCGFDVINFLLAEEFKKTRTTPVLIEFNHRSFISAPRHTINAGTFVPNLEHENVQEFLKRNNRMQSRFYIPGVRYFGSYFYYLRYFFKAGSGSKKVVSRGGNFSTFAMDGDAFGTLVENRLNLAGRRDLLEQKAASVEMAISSTERLELEALQQYLDFSYDPGLLREFERLVKLHPERTVFVVYTPQHWSERQGISNFEEITALFGRWEKELPNLRVIDLSSLHVPDSGFKNTSHLNLKGAEIFSMALKKHLDK